MTFSFLLWCCSYIIQKQKDPSKAHQIKLEVIIRALKWLEIDMDSDEVYFFLHLFLYVYINICINVYVYKLSVQLCRWSALWSS